MKAKHLLFIVLFASCSRSGTKALERGEYYDAVIQATDKLSRDEDNDKAMAVLQTAYREAVNEILGDIKISESSSKAFKWEEILPAYQRLDRLYESINGCRACKKAVRARDFYRESEDAKERAAAERYDVAMNLLNKKDKMAARTAYTHLEKLLLFAPNFRDARKQLDASLEAASLHVVVEQPKLNSRMFQYSNEYLQDRLNDFLKNNRRMNQYVRFHTPSEAKSQNLIADQVIRLEIIDFVVGQINQRVDTRKMTSKDSVLVGEATVEGKKVKVYNQVSAEVVDTKKVVSSKGVLSLQIFDYQRDKIIFSDEITGEYTWVNDWLRYNGDERALTKEQKEASKRKEEIPPSAQTLFVEFCKPIYDQTTNRIKRYYDKY